MTQNELAAALGITPAQVSQLKARGMPVDSVERAQRWRRRHLQTGRMKGVRRVAISGPTANPTDTPAGAPEVPTFEDEEPELFDEDPDDDQREIANYKNARSRREHYQAELARIALEREVGKLMQAEEVLTLISDTAVTLRTSLEHLGPQLAPVLAPVSDEIQIRHLIDREVERMLTEVSRRFEAMAAQHARG